MGFMPQRSFMAQFPRINPWRDQAIFSKRALVEFLKSAAKVTWWDTCLQQMRGNLRMASQRGLVDLVQSRTSL